MIQLIRAFFALDCFRCAPAWSGCERQSRGSQACGKTGFGLLKSAVNLPVGLLVDMLVVPRRSQGTTNAALSLRSFAKILIDTIACVLASLKALFPGYGCYAQTNGVIRKPGPFFTSQETPFHIFKSLRKRIAANTLQSLMLGFPHFFFA